MKVSIKADTLDPVRKNFSIDISISLAVFFLLLFVYTSTMSSYVHLEDDGAFILASFFNGVAHPPGYPLYTLISYCFSQINISTVAARVHFFSVVCAAITIVGIYSIIRLLTGGIFAAVIASLVFAFSEQFWSQAIIAEVYALNTALFFAILYCLLKVSVASDVGNVSGHKCNYDLYLAAFLFGLGLANHWPLLLLSTPGLILIAFPFRTIVFHRLHLLLLMLMLGLTPYIWMYFSGSNKDDFISFGEIKNISELFYYISRKGYSGVDHSAAAGWIDKIQFMQFILSESVSQYTLPLLFGAVAGIVILLRKNRLMALALISVILGNTAILVLLLDFDFDGFFRIIFMPYPLIAYGVISIFLGVFFFYIIEKISSPSIRRLVQIMLAGLPLCFLIANYAKVDKKNDLWAENFASAILSVLPENSILFVSGDFDTGPFGYLHYIKKLRPDIALYQQNAALYPNRLFHPYRDNAIKQEKILQQFILQQTRPVYATSPLKTNLPQHSMGVLWRINNSPDIPALSQLNASLEHQLKVSKVSGWIELHKIYLANNLLKYYGSNDLLLHLTKDQLNNLTSNFDLQMMYLNLLLRNYKNDIKPEFFIELVDSIDQVSMQYVKKDAKSYYDYLKARVFIEVVQQPEKSVPFLLESVRLNPLPDNPSIKLLFEWYVMNNEIDKLKILSNLTGIEFHY